MNKKTNKLKAFTLMNLMIGIIVSGIVMASFYNAFDFLNEEIKLYNEQQTGVLDMLNLQINLNKDFMLAKKVIPGEENSIVIEQTNGATSYDFQPGYILRTKNENRDTFKISVNDFQTEKNELMWVKSISLKSMLDKREIFLFFNKEYTAQQLMEAEQEAEQWH